jgi:LysR family transcriptional regulator of virulence genes
MTVHAWRTQAEVAAQTDMIFTANSLMKDLVCEAYNLNAFPLPAELETVLGLNMLWHRSRNTHPMLVWARNLFKQVVAEYTGQASAAPAHPPLLTDESGKNGKASKNGKGDAEKEGEARLSA